MEALGGLLSGLFSESEEGAAPSGHHRLRTAEELHALSLDEIISSSDVDRIAHNVSAVPGWG